MSVQNYETDILQEHVDSTPILISRLDQWRHGVHVVQSYAAGYLQVHQSIAHNLEKTYKGLADVPTFTGATQAPTTEGTNESQLSTVFKGMQHNVNLLLQRSIATANGVKASVLPPLESLSTDIEKHYKTLRQQGAKGIKEVERSRESTQKAIEHLGQVTSSYGVRALSVSDDPYILHRRVEASVSEQVARENTQAEAALNVQKSFAALESHVITTMRQALATLDTLNEGFDKGESEINTAITNLFKGINMETEWKAFAKANREQLVPDHNYQRDPRRVTFVNKNHAATQPVIQGLLNRKGTVLKNYNQSFYVLSPAGYLYQFKNADDSTLGGAPDLALFLPECQISRSSSDLVFKIAGKDATKTISTRHKYVFRANSTRELDTWFTAIARVTGNTTLNDDDSGNDDTPLQSPTEPPTAQFANTSLNSQPQTAATQAPPAIQVPPSQVPPTQVPTQSQGPTPTAVPTPAPVPAPAPAQAPVQPHVPSQAPSAAGTHFAVDSSASAHIPQTHAPINDSPPQVTTPAEIPRVQTPQLTSNIPQAPGHISNPNEGPHPSNDPFHGF